MPGYSLEKFGFSKDELTSLRWMGQFRSVWVYESSRGLASIFLPRRFLKKRMMSLKDGGVWAGYVEVSLRGRIGAWVGSVAVDAVSLRGAVWLVRAKPLQISSPKLRKLKISSVSSKASTTKLELQLTLPPTLHQSHIMAKEKPEKREKKEKKEKRSEKDGVKKEKKEKKSKPKDITKALELELQKPGIVATKKVKDIVLAEANGLKADEDEGLTQTAAATTVPLDALVPFANPLADEKQTKKLSKAVKKGTRPVCFLTFSS
jgi:hypothetical protein